MTDETIAEALPPRALVRAFCPMVTKARNDAEREVLHLISNASTDRAGDVVEPGGADLANFMRNPVVMADHTYSIDKIIGRAMAVTTEKEGLYARTKFRDTPLGDAAYKLSAEGLGGWSIGFRPVKWEALKNEKDAFAGYHFKEWELLEYSLVAIPMNQDIVNDAITRGLVSRDLVPAFFLPSAEAPVKGREPRSNAPKPEELRPGLRQVQHAIRATDRRFALRDLTAAIAAEVQRISGNG